MEVHECANSKLLNSKICRKARKLKHTEKKSTDCGLTMKVQFLSDKMHRSKFEKIAAASK